jgi:hypothetical protein
MTTREWQRPVEQTDFGHEDDPRRKGEEVVHMLMGDEILRDHDRSVPWDMRPSIDPLAAPPVLGSGFTVTVANPTPPTNISYVACGTPPTYTEVPATNPRDPTWVPGTAYTTIMKPTFTDDALIIANTAAAGGAAWATPAATTVISSPIGGGSGPVSEATGTVVVVTQPLAGASQPASAFPSQMVSVQGNYTSTPNASHASSAPHLTGLSPDNQASGGGTLALTVYGSGFNSGSVVKVATVAQTTVFVRPDMLTVAAAPRKATAGTSAVIVTTSAVDSAALNWTFT